MEVLFHFIFELIKIAILGIIYAALISITIEIFRNLGPNNWFARIFKKKVGLWRLSGRIALGLFIFMFSYYGDHGLGDSAKIPIGHRLVVENTNWDEYGHIKGIESIDHINVETTQFKIIDDKVIGNLKSAFYEFKNLYFVYNMKTQEMVEFSTKFEFDVFAEKNSISKSEDLLSFKENYAMHWRGWRFWLLP